MRYKSAKIQKRYSFSCTFSLFLIKKHYLCSKFA